MLVPGEAVDADLTILKGFFSDNAWNKLLMLGKRISFNFSLRNISKQILAGTNKFSPYFLPVNLKGDNYICC